MISISALLTTPTAAQWRAQMVTNLVVLGIPADKWRAGGVASTLLTVMSMALALCSQAVLTLLNGFFLPTASGDPLKVLALYVYGVTVPTATFASGNVTLTNSGGAVYNVLAGALTVSNPTTGVTYTNVSGFTLGALGTASVTVRASVVGSAGNANPGTVTNMVTLLLGVTCTNPSSLVGIDAPTDDAIRSLCLAALGIRSVRGVRSAYAYAVQTATNSVTGDPVNINRWSISADSHLGSVVVYVASPSGTASATDIAGVVANVELLARPEAVTATVVGVTEVAYSPTIIIYCSIPTGVGLDAVTLAAETAITNFLATYPIGGVTANDDTHASSSFTGLFGSGVTGALARGVAGTTATLLSIQGASDLALNPDEVATDSTTITVRSVTPLAGTF